jgi:hypothetical protein
MAESEKTGALEEYQLMWNLAPGPAPMVNQMLVQGAPDADGGPGELVVRLGYALPAPNSAPSEVIPVATVAAFMLTRSRAEQLREFLKEQIDVWDAADAKARGNRQVHD